MAETSIRTGTLSAVTKNTTISIGIVILLVTIAIEFKGVMDDVKSIKESATAFQSQIAELMKDHESRLRALEARRTP